MSDDGRSDAAAAAKAVDRAHGGAPEGKLDGALAEAVDRSHRGVPERQSDGTLDEVRPLAQDGAPAPTDDAGRDATPSPAMRRLRLVARVVGGAVLLAAVFWLVGFDRLAAQLRGVSWSWFAAAVACAIAANIVSTWRWSRIAAGLGLHAAFPALLSAYAQGISVNTVLPGATLGGDALRSVRLARAAPGNSLLVAASTVVLDRASGLWVLCAMSVLIAAAAFARGALPAAAGAVPLLVLAAVLLIGLAAPLWWRPARGAPQRRDDPPTALRRVQALHALMVERRAVILRSLAPSLAVQVLSGTTLWLCARAAGADAAYVAVLVVAAPVFLAAAVPASIGGFGPREAVAALAFAWLGMPAAEGVAAALLYGAAAAIQGLAAAPLLASGDPRSRTAASGAGTEEEAS